jgi:hypothetical protein
MGEGASGAALSSQMVLKRWDNGDAVKYWLCIDEPYYQA